MKSQSAMEYMFTYGAAFILLGLAVGMLYYYGVSSITNSVPSSCTTFSMLQCDDILLFSSGVMSLQMENSGPPIRILGLSCTRGITPNNFPQNVNYTMETGQTVFTEIQCPLLAANFGTTFTGTLWAEYNTGYGANQITEIGRVFAKVTDLGSPPSYMESFVPISITDTKGDLNTPFQMPLTINSITYNAYINSNWQNVEFSIGNPIGMLNSSEVNAWVSSGPDNLGNTIVWVNIPYSSQPKRNVNLYMNFLSSGSMSAGGPLGEAAFLSSKYGEYDDGNVVFPFYSSFYGRSLGPIWSQYGQNIYSVGDGLSVSSRGNIMPSYIYANPIYSTSSVFLVNVSNYGLKNNNLMVGWLDKASGRIIGVNVISRGDFTYPWTSGYGSVSIYASGKNLGSAFIQYALLYNPPSLGMQDINVTMGSIGGSIK